jgi:hypothetical protein
MPFATPMGMDSSPVTGNNGVLPGVPGERDPNIKADLENSDLWSQFYDSGTEMIITKTGR